MLREEVSGVDLAGDLAQVDAPEPYGLLDPQGVRVQVPQLA